MLYYHRWASLLAGLLILYVAVTGVMTQSMDLFAQMTHQPASNPSLQEFHQHLNGTDNYAVVSDPDYAAQSLPSGLNIEGALSRLAQAARKAAPGQLMRFIELRMVGNRVAGHVLMGRQHLLFDLVSGARLPDASLPPANPNGITPEWRSQIKSWHKFDFNRFTLQKLTILNFLAGIAVGVLTITGLIHYYRLLKVRRKIGKPELFWSAGGVWRKLHRWTATVSFVIVLYLAGTGVLMSVSDLGAAYAEWKSPRDQRAVNPDKADFSSPLEDAELLPMARTTLAAYEAAHRDIPIKVLRLRYFVGYAQGVVVTGENAPAQHVFNTVDGREMSENEPGYPTWNFPFGWQWHQDVKRLHRGDFFGLSGNWLEWLGGVSLIYFAISGLWMYYQLWAKRAKANRRSIVWR